MQFYENNNNQEIHTKKNIDKNIITYSKYEGLILTVTGLINPISLGVCMTHEHLLINLSDMPPPS